MSGTGISRGKKRGPLTTQVGSGDGEASTGGVKALNNNTYSTYKDIVEEIDEVRDGDMPKDFEVSDIEDDASSEDVMARRKLEWRRYKYWTRREEIERHRGREESNKKREEGRADAALQIAEVVRGGLR